MSDFQGESKGTSKRQTPARRQAGLCVFDGPGFEGGASLRLYARCERRMKRIPGGLPTVRQWSQYKKTARVAIFCIDNLPRE